jgi:hypothetical protein
MPKGSGLTFDHKNLKKVCEDYVDLQDVGDTIDLVEFTKYLSTKPLNEYARKPTRKVTSKKTVNWKHLTSSRPYYNRILASLDNVERILVKQKQLLVKVNEDKQLECWVCEKNFDIRSKRQVWTPIKIITCSEECATRYTDLVYNKDI